MKKVNVTGVTGFVGVNLNEYLEKDHSIQGVSRKEDFERNIITYDSLTSASLNDSFSMIHLAGKAHDLKKTSEDKEYFEVNTELTKKLFDQFLESKCEVFIYMSSVKAVADNVEGVLTEEVLPNPITISMGD